MLAGVCWLVVISTTCRCLHTRLSRIISLSRHISRAEQNEIAGPPPACRVGASVLDRAESCEGHEEAMGVGQVVPERAGC